MEDVKFLYPLHDGHLRIRCRFMLYESTVPNQRAEARARIGFAAVLAIVALGFWVLDTIAQDRAEYCVLLHPIGFDPGFICLKSVAVQPWNQLAKIGLRGIAIYFLTLSLYLAFASHIWRAVLRVSNKLR